MGFLSHTKPNNGPANMQVAYGNQQASMFARDANNSINQMGLNALSQNQNSNDMESMYTNQLAYQLQGQQSKLDALTGPVVNLNQIGPGASPGVATSNLGDQSVANVGRRSLLGM